MNFTTITAFYLTNSKKRTINEYQQWISNFLKLKMNCILFTNKDTQKWLINNFNFSNTNIRIEIYELDNFYTNKFDWNSQYLLDDEKNIHSPEIYQIWNEKINFIYLGALKNYFNSEWFIWIDIGSLRSKMFEFQNFTSSEVFKSLDSSKTYFFRIKNFYHQNSYFLKFLDKYYSNNSELNVIQGGCIISHKNQIKYICDKYYELLNELYNKGLFIGKEQVNFHPFVILNNEKIKVIEVISHKLDKIFSDAWFYYFPFLFNISEYRIINY